MLYGFNAEAHTKALACVLEHSRLSWVIWIAEVPVVPLVTKMKKGMETKIFLEVSNVPGMSGKLT